MRPARSQPGNILSSTHAAARIVFAAALCAGCANPGPPRPPSLHLPALVKDLVAERAGNQVLLRWTTPFRTTDDMDIKGTLTAELCREDGNRPATPAARAAACVPVRRLAVTPGPSQAADTLPPALQTDPPQLLTYRVQIFNAAGRSAGDSAAAFAAAGAAPPDIVALRATASESGAVLEWRAAAQAATGSDFVDLNRVDISPQPAKQKQTKPAAVPLPGKSKSAKSTKSPPKPPTELHLRAATPSAAATSDTAGTVDTSAVIGDTYTYSAQRVRTVTIAGRALELRSTPSAAVTLALRDTFPPRPPTGLAAVAGFTQPDSANPAAAPAPYPIPPQPVPYIDLSWEPNAEPDLAGYRIYRQLARPDGSPQGPLARLTELPLSAPAYRDIAVRPGQGYIYTVTAVDAAGNESAPSAKALETATPEAGESPH